MEQIVMEAGHSEAPSASIIPVHVVAAVMFLCRIVGPLALR